MKNKINMFLVILFLGGVIILGGCSTFKNDALIKAVEVSKKIKQEQVEYEAQVTALLNIACKGIAVNCANQQDFECESLKKCQKIRSSYISAHERVKLILELIIEMGGAEI